MTPELLISLAGARSLQRMDVPGTGRPYWTVREAGMACHGIRPEVFAALMYSYAGAEECFHPLRTELLATGHALRETEDWPMQVMRLDGQRRDYLDELVRMSLIEERTPYLFGSAIGFTVSPRYLVMMNVSEKTWRARLADAYAAMRWRYVTWLSIGRQQMRRWMRQQERQVNDSVAIERTAT